MEKVLQLPALEYLHELNLNLTKNFTSRLLLHIILYGRVVTMLTQLSSTPTEQLTITNMVYQGSRADSREYYRGGTRVHGSDQGSARQTVTNTPPRTDFHEYKVLIPASQKLIATNFLKLPDKVCYELLNSSTIIYGRLMSIGR